MNTPKLAFDDGPLLPLAGWLFVEIWPLRGSSE
jgi:hypothetical protein